MVDPHEMLRTVGVQNRLRNNPNYNERENTYARRKIIGHDTPIQGGVYLGASPREALVVDDGRNLLLRFLKDTNRSNLYNSAYLLMFHHINDINGFNRRRQKDYEPDLAKLSAQAALKTAQAILGKKGRETGRSETELVHELVKGRGLENDKKVNLNVFMQEGVGVCRHKALLAGYLLERMIREGKLTGKVSIDRNDDGKNAHAWVRLESEGRVFIIDPQLNYAGELKDAIVQGHRTFGIYWDYRRPSDGV